MRYHITLVPPSGTPRVSSHLTLDFVVPCPLSLPSLQTKDIFGQTLAKLTPAEGHVSVV